MVVNIRLDVHRTHSIQFSHVFLGLLPGARVDTQSKYKNVHKRKTVYNQVHFTTQLKVVQDILNVIVARNPAVVHVQHPKNRFT